MAPNSHNKHSNKAIVLFDGECNLCNKTVKFILPRDSKAYFQFASLQSEIGQKILGNTTQDFDSIALAINDKVLMKSDAVLTITAALPGIWRASKLLLIIPAFLRNWVYDLVAKNRYRIFGRRDTCLMMIPEWEERFLV